MHFVYSLHTSQEDYVLEIENILNTNCRRTISLKSEIFPIKISGGQAELGKEEEARVDGNNWPDSLCERAHRRKSREGTRGGEKGRGSSRRILPRAEGGSTSTRPSQGEHRAQKATSDVGWQEKERCDEGWWIHGLLRKNCLITSTFHIFPLKPIFYHCNKNRSYFKCTRF